MNPEKMKRLGTINQSFESIGDDMEFSVEDEETVSQLEREEFPDENVGGGQPDIPDDGEPMPNEGPTSRTEEVVDLDLSKMGWDQLAEGLYKKSIDALGEQIPEVRETHDPETNEITGKLIGGCIKKHTGPIRVEENLELYTAIFIAGNVAPGVLKNMMQNGSVETTEETVEPEDINEEATENQRRTENSDIGRSLG